MGRLKSWQNLNPLFSGKYKKLLEDFSSKDYSKLFLQETLQDFISYNCGHCGHIQKLQAEELNSILSHAFRLAYATHLHKSNGSSLTDVKAPTKQSLTELTTVSLRVPANTDSSSTPCHFSYNSSKELPQSKTVCVVNHSQQLNKEVAQKKSTESNSPPSCSCQSHPLEVHCLKNNSCKICLLSGQNIPNKFCLCKNNSEIHSCNTPSHPLSPSPSPSLSTEYSSQSSVDQKPVENIVMRTPNPSLGLSHGMSGGLCTIRKPPSDLPGLTVCDRENNNFHSPDSENSNSPTEMNTSRCLGDKPPLVKNMNISSATNVIFEEKKMLFSSDFVLRNNKTKASRMRGSRNSSPFGYINERNSNRSIDNVHTPPTHKQSLDDSIDLKVLSQNSLNSHDSSNGCESELIQCNIPRNLPHPPPLPERSDSLELPENLQLKAAAWFQAGIPREIALEVLSKEPVGAFMVRESTSKPGCFALSLRVPRDFTVSGIAHYLIVKTIKGYKIKGFTKEFSTLTALITHHSVMPELLPCPLSLSRYQPTFSTGNRDEDSEQEDGDNEDPDYSTLSDFRKMMAELDV